MSLTSMESRYREAPALTQTHFNMHPPDYAFPSLMLAWDLQLKDLAVAIPAGVHKGRQLHNFGHAA